MIKTIFDYLMKIFPHFDLVSLVTIKIKFPNLLLQTMISETSRTAKYT